MSVQIGPAMVLAEAPHHQEAITLLVDVGTNAEIVLGNRDRLLLPPVPPDLLLKEHRFLPDSVLPQEQ
ncbi:MAG: hypothetical protein Ct9H90mP9_6190 [Pseudomonadota bacterium]|nr:MAG: hypothetical protein Ct9H90mP9_6190 [Pseudomonadota bacterium]